MIGLTRFGTVVLDNMWVGIDGRSEPRPSKGWVGLGM